jgi:hypothetical protein
VCEAGPERALGRGKEEEKREKRKRESYESRRSSIRLLSFFFSFCFDLFALSLSPFVTLKWFFGLHALLPLSSCCLVQPNAAKRIISF